MIDDGPVFLSLLEMIQGQYNGFVSSQACASTKRRTPAK
jgi:hypothetical protein